MRILDDYRIREGMRYEGHHLIWEQGEDEPLCIGGMFGAAFLAAFIVDTEEGDACGIALDTDEQQDAFFQSYEREVKRDDWGDLPAEVQQLSDAYVRKRYFVTRGRTKELKAAYGLPLIVCVSPK